MKDKVEGKKKEGKYNEQYGVWENLDGSLNVYASNFPPSYFLEWNMHCILRHNNCRWEKMYSDHEKARLFDQLVANKLLNAGVPEKVSIEPVEQAVEENDTTISPPKIELDKPVNKVKFFRD